MLRKIRLSAAKALYEKKLPEWIDYEKEERIGWELGKASDEKKATVIVKHFFF